MIFPGVAFTDFDPFREMEWMKEEVDRMFSRFRPAGDGLWSAPDGFPPMNLWVGDESVVVTAEVPGVRPEDINLTVQDDVLTVQGKREADGVERAKWHRRERPYGAFVRRIQLPFAVDSEKVQARCTKGVLEVELQRPESERPKRIAVRAN